MIGSNGGIGVLGACATCGLPPAAGTLVADRLVFSTAVQHTETVLRAVGRRRGQELTPLAPGLLEWIGDDIEGLVSAACGELSGGEQQEVRCLQTTAATPVGELLGHALHAPSLFAAGARLSHADLLPLFDDELAAFHSVYQPIIDVTDGATIGFEALLRATSPEGHAVTPDMMFPAAEAAGWTSLLDRIGRTSALRGAGPWLGDDLLFVNFAPSSIYRPEVCLRTTERAASEAGIPMDQLVFEVVESDRVRDVDHLENVFRHYKALGCLVALDDFGAGYSSLNVLLRLRPDIVKLDQAIVQSLPGSVGKAIVSAIVSIAHAYGGRVLAEGVETAEQAESAKGLGVDLAQGWHFGRPALPAQR